MLPNEMGELPKMTFLLQYLTAQVGLRHHTVEVWWDNPIKRSVGSKFNAMLKRSDQVLTVYRPRPQ